VSIAVAPPAVMITMIVMQRHIPAFSIGRPVPGSRLRHIARAATTTSGRAGRHQCGRGNEGGCGRADDDKFRQHGFSPLPDYFRRTAIVLGKWGPAASATAWRPLVVDRLRVGGVIHQSRLRIDGRRAVEEPGGVRNFFMIEPSDLSHVRQRIACEATTMRKLQISQYLTPKSV
jgi:hypothetical protein